MARFSAGVQLVEVYATVTDARGEIVTGLRQDDFEVHEDNQLQHVSTFAAREFPLTVALGVPRERVSIVARSHDEEGAVALAGGASPGAEIEDSAQASRLGELGAHLLAAMALVMPGIGPIVADGPLAAGLGEAVGHAAGGIARTLEGAGLDQSDAQHWEASNSRGGGPVGADVEDS